MSLSDKIIERVIFTRDVKEFIKELKMKLQSQGELNKAGDIDSHMIYIGDVLNTINELAGEKLI